MMNALSRELGLKRCGSKRDPSGVFHVDFPSPTRVEEDVVRGVLEAHGFQVKNIKLNIRLGEPSH